MIHYQCDCCGQMLGTFYPSNRTSYGTKVRLELKAYRNASSCEAHICPKCMSDELGAFAKKEAANEPSHAT